MRKIVVFLLFLMIVQAGGAAQKEGLLLFPIKYEDVSYLDAQRIHSYLEQGLIKTGSYRIINPQDIELLLEAQELMLSPFFDETTSVEIGRLLPGRFMFLSSITPLAEGYLVNCRILAVESGQVLGSRQGLIPFIDGEQSFSEEKAVAICRDIISGVTDKKIVETTSGGAFDLTVVSDPEEGEIYIDGVLKGTTPTVISGLSSGRYIVEVKKGAFYYSKEVDLSRNRTVYAELWQQYGGMAISTQPKAQSITIDGVHYGASSFIEGIPAGPREVLLTAEGYYWKGTIPIVPDATVQIDVVMNQAVSVEVQASHEVLSSFSGLDYEEKFWGGKKLSNIPPGSYFYRAEREFFTVFEQELTLGAGASLFIVPKMTLLPELEEELFSLEETIGTLNRKIAAFDLPDIYMHNDVPDLLEYQNGITIISLIPIANLISLGTSPYPVPLDIFIQTKLVHIVQVGIGVFFDVALAGMMLNLPFMFPLVAILGGINVGIGFISGLFWDDWSQNMMRRKVEFQALRDERSALEARFAVLDALRG